MKTLPLIIITVVLMSSEAAQSSPVVPDLTGRWAVQTVATQVVKLPVLGEVKSESRALLLWSMKQSRTRLSVKQRLCALDVTMGSKSIATKIPNAFVRAARWDRFTADLVWRDSSWRFHRRRLARVFGATLKQPARDDLPTGYRDPRVSDFDGDGKPGVTLEIAGMVNGKIYVVTRDYTELHGEVAADGQSVQGALILDRERRVISASNPLLSGSPSSRRDPDSRTSYFRMKKMTKSFGCKHLRRSHKSLFKVR